ncbi:MAG: methionine biosynthesis protein MetW [Methanothrix sp.]
MDTFEIRDEEINVEEIMQKIRENIKKRKEKGAYPENEQILGLPEEQVSLCQPTKQDLDYINSSWDIQNYSYFISSHRPHTGKFLIKGRELVHGEVKRYVDPMIWKQKEFNGSVARTLNETAKKISEISQKTIELENATLGKIRSEIGDKVEEQIGLVRSEVGSKVEEQIGLVRSEIGDKVKEQIGLVRSEICNEIATQVRSVVATMNQEIENRAWLANILDKKIESNQDIEASVPTQESGLNYFLFEERFRGSRADIKQRQTAFVHYFEGCKNVLDIGCGRGEFLELLRENGIGGHGVDVDGDMVDFCTSKGLNVEKIDAISYLEKIEDKSLDGMLIDQVVEHLEPDYLIKMLRLCYRKLNFGYHILIETVNPLSFVSFANFYLDMSHKRPIHPETLKFLMASVNFREIETRFFSPVPDEMRLGKINIEGVEDRNRQPMEVYNHNIDMLNSILYGAQDYMVIGKK